MKVCVVNPNYYRSSGVTVAIRRIFQGVSTFGIEQYFINCCYGSEEEDKDWIPQEQYCEFKLMTSNPVKLAYNALLFINWLRKHNIHIVHVHHRRLAAILSTLQFLGALKPGIKHPMSKNKIRRGMRVPFTERT